MNSIPAELMKQVTEQGVDVLLESIQVVIHAAMQAERSEHLQAAPYQHGESAEPMPTGSSLIRCGHGSARLPLRYCGSGKVE